MNFIVRLKQLIMFVGLPTEESHVRAEYETDVIVIDQSVTYEGWSKLPLHTIDNGRTMRIATAASWLVNWILLFSKIAVVIVSNSKAVSTQFQYLGTFSSLFLS